MLLLAVYLFIVTICSKEKTRVVTKSETVRETSRVLRLSALSENFKALILET